MKKLLLLPALALLSFAPQLLAAQSAHATPSLRGGSEGFWVIETNINTPRNAVIHFYNEQGVQIYNEQITGKKIKVNRRKVRAGLEIVLAESLRSWNETHVARENGMLLATAIGRK